MTQTETEVEVVIIPAADDQVRTEEFEPGENVSHAVCAICHPETSWDIWYFPYTALCGKVMESLVVSPIARCPDCYDAADNKPCGHAG